MRESVRTLIALAALLVAAVAGRASGQRAPRAGELVQARIVDTTSELTGMRCLAQATASSRDTLQLTLQGTCPPGSYLADVRVRSGSFGSRGMHVTIGLLAGVAAGAAIGRALISDDCIGTCGESSGDIRTVLGATAGGMIGILAGALLPSGPRWVDAGRARPIRVGGLNVRPDVRVSIAAP